MVADDGIKFFLELLNLTRFYLNVRSLTLYATERLMNHHAAVCQGRAFPLLTGDEQHGSHRGSHTRADGGNIA